MPFAFGAARAAEQPFSAQHLWIGDNLVVAGLIDLDALKASFPGSVLVVDLRTPPEGTAEEAAAAAALGMLYRNIPVAGVSIDDAQVTELNTVLNDTSPDSLVVLHCASGNRAGMLWAAGQIREGGDVEDLLEQLSPVLNKPPAIEAVRTYAADRAVAH